MGLIGEARSVGYVSAVMVAEESGATSCFSQGVSVGVTKLFGGRCRRGVGW